MIHPDQKKHGKKKGSLNSFVAALTGIFVGAGVVVAGDAVLKDKQKSEKAVQLLTTVKDHVVVLLVNLKNRITGTLNQAEADAKKIARTK